MRRVIGMDIHRTFAEVVIWQDGRLRYRHDGIRLVKTNRQHPLACTQDQPTLRVPAPAAGRQPLPIVRETSSGTNGVTGAAVALPDSAKTAASASAGLLHMSAPQILIPKRLEVVERLRTGFMVEVMPHPVAERAAIDECCVQSEMHAYLCCKIEGRLAHFRLIRFA